MPPCLVPHPWPGRLRRQGDGGIGGGKRPGRDLARECAKGLAFVSLRTYYALVTLFGMAGGRYSLLAVGTAKVAL